jgi:hypothetical protein
MNISIVTTQEEHYKYARNMRNNRTFGTLRGTGIAKRTPDISRKMETQDAVIALDKGNLQVLLYRKLATWQVCSTFWLDRSSDYRNLGLAKKIKVFVFDYSLKKYPEAKFWITTGLAVMKINSDLYKPVPFFRAYK